MKTYWHPVSNRFRQIQECYCGGYLHFWVTPKKIEIINCFPDFLKMDQSWVYIGKWYF